MHGIRQWCVAARGHCIWHDVRTGLRHVARPMLSMLYDVVRLCMLFLRSSNAIRAENLVLRRQLARYIERGIKPRRIDHATRVSLAIHQPVRSRMLCGSTNSRCEKVSEHNTARLSRGIDLEQFPECSWRQYPHVTVVPQNEGLRVAGHEYFRMADYCISKDNRVIVIDSRCNGMRRFDQLCCFVS